MIGTVTLPICKECGSNKIENYELLLCASCNHAPKAQKVTFYKIMRDFKHSVNVLVKAYLNDTIRHGSYYSCAVGNLVADAMGFTFNYNRWAFSQEPHWYTLLYGGSDLLGRNEKEGLLQIKGTGYTVKEIGRIERAFEMTERKGDEILNGLMDVVDVLADIHGIDLKTREESKLLFQK